MAEQTVALTTKLVSEIDGQFFVPSYQRGYRWDKDEVVRLLEDILTNGQKNYCLQPIVVKNTEKGYELIDGQQRLTTLLLIYKYMHHASKGSISKPKFTLRYETREASEEFLKENTPDMSRQNDNIDFWFICNAYEEIRKWFEGHKDVAATINDINTYFEKYIQVIWYEIEQSDDDLAAISLFERLNIGKIPLTSAELVKAMFLSSDAKNTSDSRKEEIALQWDTIERELHYEPLWSFLTNSSGSDYPTRIDLLLDLIAEKTIYSRDRYDTFFTLDQMRKAQGKDAVWKKIQHTFLLLRNWFEDHDCYHKIGYLIASKTKNLLELLTVSKNMTKSRFQNELDEAIKESIRLKKLEGYELLSYVEQPEFIKRLLLLFNVESVRISDQCTQRFPFERLKDKRNGTWSLEHIHAQHSEGLRTQEHWKEWIRLHIASVKSVSENAPVLKSMEEALNRAKLSGDEFEKIRQNVVELLSDAKSGIDMHSISNLALLNSGGNAALNNSTFDVKRNKIIEMDRNGQFVPLCTKNVFLKYYTPSEQNQLHFWGYADRAAYIDEINRILGKYLCKKIEFDKGDN